MTPWRALVEPNWRDMAFDLRRWGIDDDAAAEQIGVPVGTYQAWLYGNAKPTYMNGRRFEEYYAHAKLENSNTVACNVARE